MQFSAAAIQQRLVTYTWCYGDAAWRLYQARITGDKAKQASERDRMVLIDKALDVICAYQVEGQDCCSQSASSYDDVCCMIGLVDPCCVSCGCPPGGPPADTCAPVLFATVISAVDISQRALIESGPPTEGDSYLVVTGTTDGTWNVNSVVVWTSGAWVSTFLINGRNVLVSDTAVIWTTRNNATPGHLFPNITATYIGGLPPTYNLQSNYPSISLNSTRTVQVEIRGVLGGWFLAYQGPESTIGSPYPFNVGGLDMQTIRVTYFDGLCRTTVGGTLVPPPDGCGVLVATVGVGCEGDNFSLSVYIASAAGFVLGNIIATPTNGFPVVVPAVLGTTILGPFDRLDRVSITVTNNYDSECNYDAGTFTHPSYPAPDHFVTDAVDAGFEPSYTTGSYLVVSNDDSLVGGWADHVGEIWNGTTWVVPTNNEITFASSAVFSRSYWQMVSGTQVQIFEPVNFERDGATGAWTAMPPTTIAPFMAGVNVLITFQCEGVLSPLYVGAIEGFAETPFTSTCRADLIGNVSYLFPCPLNIPATLSEVPAPIGSGGLSNYVQDVRIQQDGNFIVGGGFTSYGATPVNYVARINWDGSLDTTYAAAIMDPSGPNQSVSGVEIDSLGRALICGPFTSYNGVAAGHIVRLLMDGTVDPSFVTGSGFDGPYMGDMAIMPDGTMICVGLFDNYKGIPAANIIALNPDGSVNTSWNFGTGFTDAGTGISDSVQEVIAMANGDILVCGPFLAYNGTPTPRTGSGITRISPTGAINNTFVRTLGSANLPIADIAELPDGRILAVGSFTLYSLVAVPGLVMLNSDGSIDTAFMANVGAGFGPTAYQDIRLLANGKIMLGATVGLTTDRLIRLNADGTRDLTFVHDINSAVLDIAYDPLNDTVVVGGAFTVVDTISQLRLTRVPL